MPKTTPTDVLKPVKKGLAESTKKRKVVEALHELPDHFLECRSYRYHALKKVRLFHWKDGAGNGVCRVSVCMRCGAQRDDYYNGRQTLVDRRYTWPDGYSLQGYGYLTNDKVMRELFARATDIAASEGDIPSTVKHLALVQDAG